ncbi:Lrp/AsnC family transcriptional regulator [Actinosynnema sp. NPDC047251]|uniref:Transcriptional regulator, Lrp/AsnC family n=1 Tax=Saccharothrix espanaensis (strain ATCC 51144 / DSM 44229 / JCM 9112 / NBRC 15066 / NRRL 15764) TaxID=1179773 RepID=K3W443_SACES|nr:Lrp/AsnC family transcriptional regulator [Saccharothrix espanaensis]CCH27418.1 Transcriptional regulator, Lrp/AsnC family [Saccharothrix espanaensis DSM 44229]
MLDELDRALVHALHVNGRAPFNWIGAVLGVSTQTVTRRYRRLRAEAGLKVVGLPDPDHLDGSRWLIRLTASPATARDIAESLARRPDTSWVKLTSGGTGISALITGDSLLVQDIPRTASITSVSAHHLLHMYLGGPTAWHGRAKALTPHQLAKLTPPRSQDGQPLADTDAALLAALRRDGRTSQAELAEATGWSPVTVARRLTALTASGAVFFDVEIDSALLGATTHAMLWLSVPPAHLDHVAKTLARHEELAFVAATTGPTNLAAQALCPTPRALHRYLVDRLGTIEHITAIETAPVLRTVKALG